MIILFGLIYLYNKCVLLSAPYWFLYTCCWLKNTPVKVNRRVVLSRSTNCAGMLSQRGSPVSSMPVYNERAGMLK